VIVGGGFGDDDGAGAWGGRGGWRCKAWASNEQHGGLQLIPECDAG